MLLSDQRSIIEVVKSAYPNATEIHIQYHTHTIFNVLNGERCEGVCVCAIEGHDIRKQFTARSAIELRKKIIDNKADWPDWKQFAALFTEDV